jgi:hypothetical protein
MLRRVVRQEIKAFFEEQLARDAAEARSKASEAEPEQAAEPEKENASDASEDAQADSE